MADLTVTSDDADTIKAILLQWRANGEENLLLPMDVDVNGDGIVDSFGLDENDDVVVVLGRKIEETVYLSEGDDVDLESVEVGAPDPDGIPS